MDYMEEVPPNLLVHYFCALVDANSEATLRLGRQQGFGQRFSFINHLGLGLKYAVAAVQ